jgi:hypothetical protein
MSEDDDNIIFIAIEYQAHRYMGAMRFEALLCVSRFLFSYSRVSVFQLKRSATSVYRKIDRTRAGTGCWQPRMIPAHDQ